MKTTLAERLSELLEDNYLSAAALAREIGVSDSVVAKWVRENSSVTLSNLLKLAEYFECSADFICGRTYEQGKFHPFPPTFPERLLTLIKQSGKEKGAVLKDIGLDRHALYDWKKGSMPLSTNLIALADYFGCTVDYLIGIED